MPSRPVTVFGGTGFLGRRIVGWLAGAGNDVRVAVRRPERATFHSGPGRIELTRADVSDEASVARAVEGAAWVVNTVGHYVEKRGASFETVHGQGALNVARQAKRAGAERLIHVSGLGADPASDSPYVRARGIGERLVGQAFEGVTILRPSAIFGPDDYFLNRIAGMAWQSPVLPLFGRGLTRLQPVFVENVAEGCLKALTDSSARCRVYELGGPKVYAYRELVRLVAERIGRRPATVPVPFFVWDMLAAAMTWLPEPPLTRDQVTLMKRDNVVGEDAWTLGDLAIRPVPLEGVLPGCIDRRVAGRTVP